MNFVFLVQLIGFVILLCDVIGYQEQENKKIHVSSEMTHVSGKRIPFAKFHRLDAYTYHKDRTLLAKIQIDDENTSYVKERCQIWSKQKDCNMTLALHLESKDKGDYSEYVLYTGE